MNFKRFAIIASVFIGLIIVTLTTLGCIHINNALEIEEPSKIVYYVKSAVGVTRTEKESPKVFNTIKEKFNKSTNLSVFDYMAKGISLKSNPTQDYNNEFSPYSATLKENGVCLEFIYENKQSIVVEIDGNTKVVEFYSFIVEVKNSASANEIALYFSTSSGEYKDYDNAGKNPIVIVAKQKSLHKYIMSLVEE